MSYLFNSILFRKEEFNPAEIKRTFLWMRSGYHPQAEDPKHVYYKEEFILAPVNENINAIFYFLYTEKDKNDFYEAFKWMYAENFLAHVSNASRQSRNDYRFYGFFHNNQTGPLDVGIKYEDNGYEVRYLNGLEVYLQKMEGSSITQELDFKLRPDYSSFQNSKGELVDEEGVEEYFNELKKPYDGRIFITEELGITYNEINTALHYAYDKPEIIFSF